MFYWKNGHELTSHEEYLCCWHLHFTDENTEDQLKVVKQEFALQTPLTLPLTTLLMVSIIIVIITNGFMTILALFLFF